MQRTRERCPDNFIPLGIYLLLLCFQEPGSHCEDEATFFYPHEHRSVLKQMSKVTFVGHSSTLLHVYFE